VPVTVRVASACEQHGFVCRSTCRPGRRLHRLHRIAPVGARRERSPPRWPARPGRD